MSVQKFRESWMRLPRAVSATRSARRAVWRQFSENMAEHLLWESARALRLGDLRKPLRSLSIIPRLHPLTLMQIARHRVFRTPRGRLPESLASFSI
jgi:hypothetical protein